MSSLHRALLVTCVLLMAAATCAGDVTMTVGRGISVGPPPPIVDADIARMTQTAVQSANGFVPLPIGRSFFMIGLAEFEGLVPYLDTARGPITGVPLTRALPSERTLENKKKSVMHAIYTAFTVIYGPRASDPLGAILRAAGSDPSDTSTGSTPAGFGNRAGRAIAAFVADDGSNQKGNLLNKEVWFTPFEDYTGYEPANTAYRFQFKDKWQPLKTQIGPDFSYVQQFVGAQACNVTSLPLSSPTDIKVPKPGKWMQFKHPDYIAAAETVLEYSRKLHQNDTAKMLAEFTASFPSNLVTVIWGAAVQLNLSFDDQRKFNLGYYTAYYQATLVTLCWKRKYDTARPISVIRSSGCFDRVVSYGGPAKGNVGMPASDWKQYLFETPPEPEYPSGAAMIFSSFAQVGSRLSNSPALGVNVLIPARFGFVEGAPSSPITLRFATWDQLAQSAVVGRVLAGLHFLQATEAGYAAGKDVGNAVADWVNRLLIGQAENGN